VKHIEHIPIVLNQHNIEYMTFRNIGKSSSNTIKKLLYYFESIKLKKYESNIYHRNKSLYFTFVSSDDKEFFERVFKNYNTKLIPIGADINIDESIKEISNTKTNIVFIGNMSYTPNIEGIKWFYKNVWKLILEKKSNCKLYIVGKNPTQEIRALQSDNIIVTGTVDRIQPYLEKADIFIVPLISGGGVKVKLIEALANNQLVISTSKGIEGTLFKDKQHLFVEDLPERFAERCIDALENKMKYKDIILNAKNMVIENYLWSSICEDYNNYLSKVKDSYNKSEDAINEN